MPEIRTTGLSFFSIVTMRAPFPACRSDTVGEFTEYQWRNWASRIDSLKVGPKATLVVFENINFKLTLKEIEKYPDLMRSLGVTEQDVKKTQNLFLEPMRLFMI